MAYHIAKNEDNDIFRRFRMAMSCECADDVPIAIRIPRIDPTMLDVTERAYYSQDPFLLQGRCVKCRHRQMMSASVDEIPTVNTNARLIIANTMAESGCPHQLDHFFITDPVLRKGQYESNDAYELAHLVYCNSCRHVVTVYLPYDDIIY